MYSFHSGSITSTGIFLARDGTFVICIIVRIDYLIITKIPLAGRDLCRPFPQEIAIWNADISGKRY